MTVTGAGLLWVGWFGFNAGSSLAAEWPRRIRICRDASRRVSGDVDLGRGRMVDWRQAHSARARRAAQSRDLVAITPASGYVGPGAAIVIGGVAGALCYSAVRMKSRFGYDDALDVVGVHAVGGIWGALATGLFASVLVNAAGANGLLLRKPAPATHPGNRRDRDDGVFIHRQHDSAQSDRRTGRAARDGRVRADRTGSQRARRSAYAFEA